MRNFIVLPVLMLLLGACASAGIEKESGGNTFSATIDVDAAKVINTFKPVNIFGNNTNGWTHASEVKEKIQSAGNFLLRYPGGSWGDGFFWNTNGAADSSGNWVPSTLDFAESTTGDLVYHQKNIIDSDNSTAWRSNTDTDFPGKQWVYFDLGGKGKKRAFKISVIKGHTGLDN